jgi:hypothetical protein
MTPAEAAAAATAAAIVMPVTMKSTLLHHCQQVPLMGLVVLAA